MNQPQRGTKITKIMIAIAFVLTIAMNAFAQGGGGISGTVTDENDAKVVGAQVVLTSSSEIGRASCRERV